MAERQSTFARKSGDRRGLHSGTLNNPRRGTIAILAVVVMIPVLGMVAFAVDYAYLLKKKTELQRAADSAALAASRDLLPDSTGFQNMEQVRETIRQYVRDNLDNPEFEVLDSDIVIGRYEPSTVYTDFTILDYGIADTVQVTVRLDATANTPVDLYFASALGINTGSVTATATAILQKGTLLYPGSEVLPFAVHEDLWNSRVTGDNWNIYSDGRVEDEYGLPIPGNWGTIDIGAENNSTSDMSDQIINGLRQSDLDALHDDGRIPNNEYIDSTEPWFSQADTGLSSGLKHAVQAVHGQIKLVPIYDFVSGDGNNTNFRVVRWGVVTVVDSHWAGANNTHVTITKAFTYGNPTLRPQKDLSNTSNIVDGAYTSPALVQ